MLIGDVAGVANAVKIFWMGRANKKVKNQGNDQDHCHRTEKTCSRVAPLIGREICKRFMGIECRVDGIFALLIAQCLSIGERNSTGHQ